MSRHASTYRAARRNSTASFQPLSGDLRPMRPARYMPYQIKPPVLKTVGVDPASALPIRVLVARKQPKLYPYASKRQNTRNDWRAARFEDVA